MWFSTLLVPITLLLFTILQLEIGTRLYLLIVGWIPKLQPQLEVSVSYRFILGLLVHLALVFLLKCLQLPWFLAAILPLLPVCLTPRRILSTVAKIEFRPTLPFVIWSSVIFLLGVSLFQVTLVNGIETPWVNNYGDLSFHFGMITSFVWGENFPPEYHLFVGTPLTYPFFINLWSATLWWIHPTFQTLKLIFIFQWYILWLVIYYALKGDRLYFIPWALLFGGGSLLALNQSSAELITNGYPWSNFLPTIWVTQRSALFGAATCALALRLFHDQVAKDRGSGAAFFCGLLLGCSILAHTHFFLVTVLYMGLYLLWLSITDVTANKSRQLSNNPPPAALIMLVAGTFCCLPLLPWILGKSAIVHFSFGWMPWPASTTGFESRVLNSICMWAMNLSLLGAFFLVCFFIQSIRLSIAIVVLLFVLGNIVQFNVWDWDQIKYFTGLYLVFLCLLSSQPTKTIFRFHFILLALMIPAIIETANVFKDYKLHKIYSANDLKNAAKIRSFTSPRSVIVAKPDHNSLVTLTGRSLYFGYEGTLYSHKIDYQDRKIQLENNLESALACSKNAQKGSRCPTYLLWTDKERDYFKTFSPTQSKAIERTPFRFLYRVHKPVYTRRK